MDDDDGDDLEIETLDDGEDDRPEFGENMSWPSALAWAFLFLAAASMWHDCFGHR